MLVWGPMKVWLRGSGVLSSVCDVLEMSVVRGVGGVCDMCMCSGRGDRIGFLALPFLGEHGESGICVSVLVAVVLGESGWAALGLGG